jgi:cytochrome d ubiquinol oxidase subunit I
LPLAACQLGWSAAEVGRQPWIVYHLLKTKDAISVTVGAGEILFSIILFALIYILLFSVLFVLLKKKVNNGFEILSEEAN